MAETQSPLWTANSETHIWVRHKETGGHWQCPKEALDHFTSQGWEVCDPPREPNPALDERTAWLESLRAEQAAAAEAETKSTRGRATRHVSEESEA